MMYPDN